MACGSEMLRQSANYFYASDGDMSATTSRGGESYVVCKYYGDCELMRVLQVRS